jgi:carboxypeptidase Q
MRASTLRAILPMAFGVVVAAGAAGAARTTQALTHDAATGTGAGASEPVDLDAIQRIKEEAFGRSQVMDHLYSLTDANGPRLTGSPGFARAAAWAVEKLRGFGMASPRLETWGRFGRGWSVSRFSLEMTEPVYTPLPAAPRAWCSGTGVRVSGDVVSAPLWGERDEESTRYDLARYAAQIDAYAARWRGKLRGHFVLIDPVRTLAPPDKPESERYDAAGLETLFAAPDPHPVPKWEWPLESLPADEKQRNALTAWVPQEILADFGDRRMKVAERLNAFLREEGVLGVLASDRRGDGGIVFVERAGSWSLDTPPAPPTVVVAPEAYNRVARLVERGPAPRLALDLDVRLDESSPDASNVIAEIPGGKRRDEVVMLGAHLDSWHGGTGATDNAAGCAVVMEAARIIKALGLRNDRTIRLALWSGEEQGLLGSRAYVKQHFADPVTMTLKPEHARLSAYFNLDNGTGRIRGIYLQGNDAARPIFEAWLGPFRDLGVEVVTIRNTGRTDHRPFDSVGLPAFQFVQDPIDYDTRSHHSDMDVYDRAQAGDLMQAAAVMASTVYHAANRERMLPRKPLPPPLPPKKAEGAGASATGS